MQVDTRSASLFKRRGGTRLKQKMGFRFKTYRGYLRFVCTVSIILVAGALIVDVVTIKKIFTTRALSSSTHYENGIIHKVSSSPGLFWATVFFYSENSKKLYRSSDFNKNIFKGKPGDTVRVVFNEARSKWILIDHLDAMYTAYIAQLVFSVFFMTFGIIFLKIIYPDRKNM
jgi:hypothetical protein